MPLALLIGDLHSGKTTTCQRLAELVRSRGRAVGGIVAPAVHESGRRVGYEVVDLATNQAMRLATLDGPGVEQIGRFHFLAEGLAFGKAALQQAAKRPECLVIVDEVGPLELAGGGWSEQLDRLVDRPGLTLMVVRREMAGQVAERWNVSAHLLYDLGQGADAVMDAVIERIEA